MIDSEKVTIQPERCVGCGICVKVCPFGAISLQERKARVDPDKCTLCGACADACVRYDAIRYPAADNPAPRPAEAEAPTRSIWVFVETEENSDGVTGVSLELLGAARRLAGALHSSVTALLMGHSLAHSLETIRRYGVDSAVVVDSPRLAHFDDEIYAGIAAELIGRYRPRIFLGGATAIGRALLPRIAVLVHTGLTADCTELEIDEKTGLLLQTRPAFGGNILATIVCREHFPQMATVRPGVLPRPTPGPAAKISVRRHAPPAGIRPRKILQSFQPRQTGEVGLREAEIIVSAGYGAGGPEGVRLVAKLAAALGATLGASRAVVDAGWIEYPHQVGQTGVTVQPRLYIACGISGAVQHIVGMQNSETIIAINRDPEAPIFKIADIAWVGDLFEIIPALLNHLEPVRA